MKVLNKIFLRSFFLQSVWNYERMQSVGFLFSMLPRLREIYTSHNELKKSCQRHLAYFNTHPYMVSFILGFTTRAEEEIKDNVSGAEEVLSKFKLQMGGPLAAIGDKLFWSTWRPLVGLIAVLGVYLSVKPGYLIPLIFILLYNFPVFCFRYRILKSTTLDVGWITEVIKKINTNFIIRLLPKIGIGVVLTCLTMSFLLWGSTRGGMLLTFTAGVVIARRCCAVSSTKLLYIVTAAVFAGNLIF